MGKDRCQGMKNAGHAGRRMQKNAGQRAPGLIVRMPKRSAPRKSLTLNVTIGDPVRTATSRIRSSSGSGNVGTLSYSKASAGEITGRHDRRSMVCNRRQDAPRLERNAATSTFGNLNAGRCYTL